MVRALYFLILLIASCSRMERSEKEKMKQHHMTFKPIVRHHDEKSLPSWEMTLVEREKYPWEKSLVGRFAPITKEHFRCKGNSLNPVLSIKKEGGQQQEIKDCGGIDKHSLPIRAQKEFIYPILIELLNEIQKKLSAKVIITSAHRCPEHQLYCDQSTEGKFSKHLIGAEVDFYVEGYENKPQEVLQVIRQFYQDEPRYKGMKEFQNFVKNDQSGIENKEITTAVRAKNSHRDFDNRHRYPFITLTLKYDFAEKKRVEYSWKEAHLGIMQN